MSARAESDGGGEEDGRDEDFDAIVEAEHDAVDRSVHPSGIVPVLQYVSDSRAIGTEEGGWAV